MPKHALKSDLSTSQDLSSAALSYQTSIGRRFKLESVSIHASVSISETITITKVSALGSNYNIILSKKTLESQQDFLYRPSGEDNFLEGDEIKVECTNANTTGIVYSVVKTSELLRGA